MAWNEHELTMKEIIKTVFASNNEGKLREFSALLAPLPIQLISQKELGVNEIEENGLTFVENAISKARHAARITGLPAIADDSGLCVPVLKGAPGIFSARFSGKNATSESNIAHLLSLLQNEPEKKRFAFFYCTMVWLQQAEDPVPFIAEGRWEGSILTEPRGHHGFGYDPVFYVPTHNTSAAELPLEIKNTLSHRGRAVSAFLKQYRESLCLHFPSNN